MAVSVSVAQLPCGERGALIQVRQTQSPALGIASPGVQRPVAEASLLNATGQVPSVPPAFKIRSRTLGWALFVARGAYQLLWLTR